jgi:hypothetical protein
MVGRRVTVRRPPRPQVLPDATASSDACPAFFRPPCPCRRLAASGRRRSRWSTPRSPLLRDCCTWPANAIADERPGRTPARRGAPAERRRQGGQMVVREADTACARAREARSRSTTPHHTSLVIISARGQARGGTAGPCCGGRWVAGYPCAPVLGGEDGRAAAARRRRLRWWTCATTRASSALATATGPRRSPASARCRWLRPWSRRLLAS